MKRGPKHVPHEPMETQYFPEDIPLSKGYSRTINCGSYNGDTIRSLNRHIGKIKALACFEPELANYALLDDYLTRDGARIAEDIRVLPYGVYSRDVELFFASGNQFNSNLSETGDISIQCVTIDRLLPDFAPSFINMDIEGAELEALKGAEQVIRRYTPDLAICIYHVMDHLWQIPDFLNRLNVGYKFYMRNYTGYISETVVYATTTKANTELCFGKAKRV